MEKLPNKSKPNNNKKKKLPKTKTRRKPANRKQGKGNGLAKRMSRLTLLKAGPPTDQRNNEELSIAKRVARIARGVIRDGLDAYISQTMNPKLGTLAQMPLLSNRCYLKRVNYRQELTVNAGGSAMVLLPPAYLMYSCVAVDASPIIAMNDAAYVPTSTTHAAPILGFYPTFFGASGTNFAADEFDNVAVIGGSIDFRIVGVTNYTKKGLLHVGEDVTNLFNVGAQAVTDTSATLNRYPIQHISKFTNYQCVSLLSDNVSSTKPLITYTYIPDVWEKVPKREPIKVAVAGAADTVYENTKLLVAILEKCDANTTLVLDYNIIFQCRPNASRLNQYPVSMTEEYEDPNPYLRYLCKFKDLILH